MSLPRSYRIYLMALTLVGAGLLVLLGRLTPPLVWTGGLASAAALWTLLLLLAELSPIPLPRGGARAKLTPVVETGAFCVFGPALTCGLGLAGRLMAAAFNRDGRGWRLWADLARTAVTLGGTGLAWRALGGPMTSPGHFPAGGLGALVGAPLVYFVLKTGLDTLAVCLRDNRTTLAHWRTAVRWEMAHDFLFLPFGLLLAQSQFEAGNAGVALFLVPLLLARYSFRLWHDTKRAHLITVRTLVDAMDSGDPYTRGLAHRVARYSSRIARHMGLAEPAREELEYGALLHDLGRRFIQNDMLRKPGRLDSEEVRVMQTHPQVGHDLLTRLPFMEGAAELVLCHHEQPNGRGYPRGLTGAQIPPGARILMVAAAFDAMTVDRPYRKGLPAELACQELERCSGTQFFPDAVVALVDLYRTGRICEDFTPAELELYMPGSTVSSQYQDLLADLRLSWEGPDQPTIELSEELLRELEGALAGGADSVPAAHEAPDADDQLEGDSRKAASA